ncbi:T9SS type A sorting domain-containing protein [Spirosoma sp. HMF3257]|uniref:T9SS C-terminal target domain-containing protein n=1 Tax=Spirosoma telluris TaxID=2183553 RepID=A0A327NE68_9BACT|nr:T9SS type A sorting domain-containing protein [Spirosoma telluris]RAI73412.1 T9SS C-terminal target domain-containing protein [Spirosoma telluris]
MKKVLILMLGLVASTASFAHHVTTQPTAAQAHMLMTAEHKIKLYIQPLPTKAQLGIQDAHGQSVYSATVALQKGLSQQFDISGLGAGTYRFTISTGTETLTKTFVVQATPEESFVIQES